MSGTDPGRAAYKNASLAVSKRVDDLLSHLSLEEKLAQLGSAWFSELFEGTNFSLAKAVPRLQNGIGQITRISGDSDFSPRQAAEAANTLQRFLVEQTRLGIPAIVHEECCSGVMGAGAPVYPQMIGLASTFRPELACAMTSQIRRQLRAVGAHQGLAPVLDVARDPRWGRVEETFGEDPLLVAQMGSAYVAGLQGKDLASGVMATAKHFAGYSISEGGLNCAPVRLGPHELREVYLAPFMAAIQEAGLASVMNAYVELDGAVVAASRAIMTGLLRDELGFDGLVVSDYNAVAMLHNYHHVAAGLVEAAALALKAGIDVELPSTDCYGVPLKKALEQGLLDMGVVDEAVRRVLRKKFELGLFENPYFDPEQAGTVWADPQARLLAEQIGRESLVLLKNEGGLLPLSREVTSLAVIGPAAHDLRGLYGDYTYAAHWEASRKQLPELPDRPTILEALKAKAGPGVKVMYEPGCGYNEGTPESFDQALAAAGQAQVVVAIMGERAGLARECHTGESRDRAILGLPELQGDLLRELARLGKPLVLVLVNGRPLAIPEAASQASAILEAWLPGESGGQVVAQALWGEYNPAGRLPVSVPRAAGQLPVYYNHKPSGRRSHWYGDYADLSVQPLFPFGHGLSYTRFEYRNLVVTPAEVAAGQTVEIRLKVINVGERAGEEVVQLYLRDPIASLPRPVKELKAFLRVALDPGQSLVVTFVLPVDLLAFYDEDLRLVVEPGEFQVMVGASSEDIRLEGAFAYTGDAYSPAARLFRAGVRLE
jgi:beta-glucosidase